MVLSETYSFLGESARECVGKTRPWRLLTLRANDNKQTKAGAHVALTFRQAI
jgi:hypothetical protein